MVDADRKGYQEDFLGDGIIVPIPQPSLELQDDILRKEEFRNEYIVDYIHYSAIISKSNRQALVSAANLDQSQCQSVSGRNWFIDPRIGAEYQIGNTEGYKKNEWDRGHLTRRTAVTWGDPTLARRASNDSCSYANSSLQHANFNQDEWKEAEDQIREFDRDKNQRLCIFTGPYFSEVDRWYTPRGSLPSVRIPSGFWKVVAYIDRESDQLACLAFIMFQDDYFMADKRGEDRGINLREYQISLTELERLTGLEFDDALAESNPLYYHPREGINIGPEGYVVRDHVNPKARIFFSRIEAEDNEGRARRRDLRSDEIERVTRSLDSSPDYAKILSDVDDAFEYVIVDVAHRVNRPSYTTSLIPKQPRDGGWNSDLQAWRGDYATIIQNLQGRNTYYSNFPEDPDERDSSLSQNLDTSIRNMARRLQDYTRTQSNN